MAGEEILGVSESIVMALKILPRGQVKEGNDCKKVGEEEYT